LGDLRRDASGNFYLQNGSQSNALLFATSANVLTSTSNLIFQIDANNVSTTRSFEIKNNDNFTGGNLLFSINESGNVSMGKITTYNSVVTQAAGVPYIVGSGRIDGIEDEGIDITSYTNPPGANRVYRVNGYTLVTGFSTGEVGLEVVHTDGGVLRIRRMFGNLGSSTTGFSRNSVGLLACFPELIRSDANTSITVRTVMSGTAQANFSATIERLE
jgi:hypothetical protein